MSTAKIFDMVDEWNDAATTFTAIKMNVTDTASQGASNLIDLQVGGVSRFRVQKDGAVSTPNNVVAGQGAVISAGVLGAEGASVNGFRIFMDGRSSPGGGSLIVGRGGAIRFSDNFGSNINLPQFWGFSLSRDGDDTLAQRRGANAQTSRIYGTYTDASNHRRLSLRMSTGGVAEIKPEGAGTGESGNVLHISGLPTSNPGPGILWNDGGDVKVGT